MTGRQSGSEGPTVRNRTVAYFLHYPDPDPGAGSSSGSGTLKGQVQNQHGDWKRLLVRFGGHRRLFPNSASHGGSATGVCISRIVTPRDRSPFIAGKMDVSRTKAREILHARHDFPQCRRRIQLLMANPSACAGLRRNSADNPAP